MQKKYAACLFVIVQLFYFSAAACPTGEHPPVTLTRARPQFTLTLKSNPSTGYAWSVRSYNPHLLTLVEHHYQKPTREIIGTSGVELWTFKVNKKTFAVAPCSTKVVLQYKRPWEKNKPGELAIQPISIE